MDIIPIICNLELIVQLSIMGTLSSSMFFSLILILILDCDDDDDDDDLEEVVEGDRFANGFGV